MKLSYGNININLTSQLVVLFLSFIFLLSSCSEEINSPGENNDEVPGLTLRIPFKSNFNSSRALDLSEEAYMSNLYLVALRKGNDNNETMEVHTLDASGAIFITDEKDPENKKVYQEFRVNLVKGNYRFYVFANLDAYLNRASKISDFNNEEELKQLYLNFSTDVPIRPAHIPMMCEPKDIQITDDGPSIGENQYVNIEGYNSTIYINMKYLCSKVRYTILFDATQPDEQDQNGGISSDFKNNSLRFNVDANLTPVASFLRAKTYIFQKPNVNEADPILKTSEYYETFVEENGKKNVPKQTNIANWPIDLNRFQWPSDGINYPLSPSQELSLWENGLDSWKASRQRAWQGVCYLPENDDSEVQHTSLAFPFVIDQYPFKEGDNYKDGTFNKSDYKMLYLFGDNQKEKHFNGGSSSSDIYGNNGDYDNTENNNNGAEHGIRRGIMYDVVALVKTYTGDKDIEVYVKVKDWDYKGIEGSW